MYKHPRVFVNTLGRLQTPCYGQKPYDNNISLLRTTDSEKLEILRHSVFLVNAIYFCYFLMS